MAVRVLLCGMGGYGENYIDEYLTKDVEGSTLVAVADPFASKSPKYQEVVEKGIPVFESPEAFFKDHKVDLTIISSPIHTHYPYIMTALKNGSNVLSEKPICFNLEQIDEMIRESEARHLFVALGYQLCYRPDVLALKKDILGGLYGRCLRAKTIRMMRRDDIYYSRNGWAGKLFSHGEKVLDSPFCNACAHEAQNEFFLLGKSMEGTAKVAKVDGELIRVRPTIENYDTAALRFTTSEGIPLWYYTSHAVDAKAVGPLSVYEFEKGTVTQDRDGFVGKLSDGTVKDYRALSKEGERMEKLYVAVRAVKGECDVPCTLRTGYEHTRAVLMAQEIGITDLSSKALKKLDDKGSAYYTLDGLEDGMRAAYDGWRLPLVK